MNMDMLGRMREALVDERYWDKGMSGGRTYVYGDGDLLVKSVDVEGHAAEAVKRGYERVELVKVEGSLHVAHAVKDPERYWGAVRKVAEGWS